MKTAAQTAAISLLALFGAACGYALVGRGMTVDPTIKRVGVPLFRDMTGKPELELLVTQKVIEELTKRGRFVVVSDRENVNAIVEGELTGYTQTPIGIATTAGSMAQASRYSIRVIARVRYIKVGQEEPLWSNDAYAFSESYDMGEESVSFIESDQAIERLATAFARQLVADMLEAF
jgi:hypothetical protein